MSIKIKRWENIRKCAYYSSGRAHTEKKNTKVYTYTARSSSIPHKIGHSFTVDIVIYRNIAYQKSPMGLREKKKSAGVPSIWIFYSKKMFDGI